MPYINENGNITSSGDEAMYFAWGRKIGQAILALEPRYRVQFMKAIKDGLMDVNSVPSRQRHKLKKLGIWEDNKKPHTWDSKFLS